MVPPALSAIFCTMESPLPGIEAGAAVLHLQHGGGAAGAQPHHRRPGRVAVLDGVAEQVIDDAAQVFGRERHCGAAGQVHVQLGFGFGQGGAQVEAHGLDHGGQAPGLGGLGVGLPKPGEIGALNDGWVGRVEDGPEEDDAVQGNVKQSGG